MAKQKENCTHFSGKVGGVVECSWKGIRYIRSLPSHVKDAKSPAQLRQRSKFKASHRFVKAMLCTVNVGYEAFAVRQTAYNACLSHTLRHVAQATSSEATLDYSKALLGEGALAVPQNCTLSISNNSLKVCWDSHSWQGYGHGSDTTLLALYCVERNQALQIFDSAQRLNGEVQVKLPSQWQGCTIECFVGFRSVDQSSVSNIGHMGEIVYSDTPISRTQGNGSEPVDAQLPLLKTESLTEVVNSECSPVKVEDEVDVQASAMGNSVWHALCAQVKEIPLRCSRMESSKEHSFKELCGDISLMGRRKWKYHAMHPLPNFARTAAHKRHYYSMGVF